MTVSIIPWRTLSASLPAHHRLFRVVSCAVGLAHTRFLNTYLAHPSMTCASPPSHKCVTEPVRHGLWLWGAPTMSQEPPQQARDRRTSLPVMSRTRSSFSNMSDHPQDTSRHLGLQHYDEWLKAVLESMLDGSREEIRTMRLGLVPTVARAQRRRMQPSTRSCLYFTCNGRSLKRAAWLTARWTPGASSTSNLSRLSSRPRRDPGDITTGSRSYPALR